MQNITIKIQSSLDYQVASIEAIVTEEELNNGISNYLIDKTVSMVTEASTRLGTSKPKQDVKTTVSQQPVRQVVQQGAQYQAQPRQQYQQQIQPLREKYPAPQRTTGPKLITPKQMEELRRYGYNPDPNMTSQEAWTLIGDLHGNN